MRQASLTAENKITFQKRLAEFYPELKKRVDAYFVDNNISKYANGEMITKTVVLLSCYALSYVLIVIDVFHPMVMLALAALHGLCTAHLGMSIGHDAIHGSYSKNKKVNHRLGTVFNIIGANDYVWSITHNILHHTFTNIPEHDDDIAQIAILRTSPSAKLRRIHKLQFLYAFMLYPLASLTWVFSKDYIKFFSKKIGEQPNKKHPKREVYRLFGYKMLYYFCYLALPMIVIDQPWYFILLGFLTVHLFEGLTLALVFQLAHLVQGTSFAEPDDYGNIENSWAVHQLYTTADFARKSRLANLFCGGLNFQIEHHLFPKICHIHYKQISPIVKQTAQEFGLPFVEHKSMLSAIVSHIRVLKRLGREEAIVSPL